jgi:hypothetical protein
MSCLTRQHQFGQLLSASSFGRVEGSRRSQHRAFPTTPLGLVRTDLVDGVGLSLHERVKGACPWRPPVRGLLFVVADCVLPPRQVWGLEFRV